MPTAVSRFAVGSSASRIARRAGERARDGDALLLSARQVARQEVQAVAEADRLERALRPRRARVAAAHALHVQRVLDVLERVSAGNRLYCWKTKPIERSPDLAAAGRAAAASTSSPSTIDACRRSA